jgi:hypothetical protein
MDQLHAALDHGLPGGIEPHLPLLIAEAERCASLGDHREAIQRWQDIAALQANANRAGFGGSKEENTLWGDMSKHTLLAWLQPAPELAFIAGMHLIEFALRDLIHSEARMAPKQGVVLT